MSASERCFALVEKPEARQSIFDDLCADFSGLVLRPSPPDVSAANLLASILAMGHPEHDRQVPSPTMAEVVACVCVVGRADADWWLGHPRLPPTFSPESGVVVLGALLDATGRVVVVGGAPLPQQDRHTIGYLSRSPIVWLVCLIRCMHVRQSPELWLALLRTWRQTPMFWRGEVV